MRRLVGLSVGAEILGLKVATVRKWLRLRRLPFYRVGGRVLLDEADVERFVSAGRVDAREEGHPAPVGTAAGGTAAPVGPLGHTAARESRSDRRRRREPRWRGDRVEAREEAER